MPFRSKAQQRWMYAAEANGEVPAGTAKHWSAETKKQKGGFKALPERVAAQDVPTSEKSGVAGGTATGASREPDGTKTGAARELHGTATVATRRQLHLPDGSVLDLINPGQYKAAMNMPMPAANPNADMLQQLRAYMRVGQGPIAGASLQPQDPSGAVPGLPGGMAKNVIAQNGGLAGESVVGAGAPGVGAKMAEAKYRIEDTQLFGRLKTAGLLDGLGKATAAIGKTLNKPSVRRGPTVQGAGVAPHSQISFGPSLKQRVQAGDGKLDQWIRQNPGKTTAAVLSPLAAGAGLAMSADRSQPAQAPTGKAPQPAPAAKPKPTPNPVGVPPAPEPAGASSITQPDTDNYGEFVNQITTPPATSPTATAGPPGYVKPSLAQSQMVGKPPASPQTGLAKTDPAAPPKPNASPDWMARIMEFLKDQNNQGALLGMGAAGLGDYLLSSKDDREERSGFSSILPWLLGGGAGYYFGPELMKLLGGTGQATPETQTPQVKQAAGATSRLLSRLIQPASKIAPGASRVMGPSQFSMAQGLSRVRAAAGPAGGQTTVRGQAGSRLPVGNATAVTQQLGKLSQGTGSFNAASYAPGLLASKAKTLVGPVGNAATPDTVMRGGTNIMGSMNDIVKQVRPRPATPQQLIPQSPQLQAQLSQSRRRRGLAPGEWAADEASRVVRVPPGGLKPTATRTASRDWQPPLQPGTAAHAELYTPTSNRIGAGDGRVIRKPGIFGG